MSGKGASPEDVYYGAKLLAALGQQAPGVCATAQALLGGNDAAAVGFGLGALKEGGCAAELAAAGESEAVVSALKRAWQAETFAGKRLALLGELALGGGGKALASVDAAMKQLNKHRGEEGLVQEVLSEAGAASSTEGTFALLETIALGKVGSKGIRKTLEKALLLLPGGAVDAGASDASLLVALDQALKALGAEQAPAASVAALKLEDEQVAVLARKLLRMKGVASPKAAYKVLAGLQLLKDLPNAPLAVVVATPVVAPGEAFKVEVKTLLGQPPAGSAAAAVVVESLQLPGKGHGLEAFADQPLKAVGSGVFEGQTQGLAPGLYELVLAVGGAGGVKRSLIVQGDGAVEGVEVTVAGKTFKGALPAVGAKAVALEGDGVRVAFTLAGSPAPAQQAFLRFTQLGAGAANPVETLYAAKRTERAGGDGWDYSAGVVLADEMAAFAYASGDYELSLLVGDVSLARPLELPLGRAQLAFPPKPKEHFPLYTRPLLWDSDNALAPLPEIHHQFRQPERRPNPVVPAAFTALVLAALAFFALYLPRVGANLEAFPATGSAGSAWAAAFMACLAGFVLLFAAYWLKLKAVDTLRYLLGLALATLFVGHQAFGGARNNNNNKAASSASASS